MKHAVPLAWSGLMWFLFYMATVERQAGAENVLLFVVWTLSLLVIVGLIVGVSNKERSPVGLRAVTRASTVLLIAAFAWVGWFATAAVLLFAFGATVQSASEKAT
jgi:amino acid transporter